MLSVLKIKQFIYKLFKLGKSKNNSVCFNNYQKERIYFSYSDNIVFFCNF